MSEEERTIEDCDEVAMIDCVPSPETVDAPLISVTVPRAPIKTSGAILRIDRAAGNHEKNEEGEVFPVAESGLILGDGWFRFRVKDRVMGVVEVVSRGVIYAVSFGYDVGDPKIRKKNRFVRRSQR